MFTRKRKQKPEVSQKKPKVNKPEVFKNKEQDL